MGDGVQKLCRNDRQGREAAEYGDRRYKDMVASPQFGAGCSEAGRNAAMAAIAELKAGKPIYAGTVKSNAGKVISDKDTGLYDPSLEYTDYLVEGIVGTV